MSEERCNMFNRLLDRRDVVDFVREIEKYQCLYDQNSFQYANKQLKRRTWLDIAKKYKSSVPDCKEKWRKIRIAYMRSLKLSKSGNPPSRPYYLADYLHFISPNRKVDDNVPTTNSALSPASSEESFKLEIDEYDHLADSNERIDEHQQERYVKTHENREEFSSVLQDSQCNSRAINLSSNNDDRIMDEVNSRLNGEISRDICSRRSATNARFETQRSFSVEENNPRKMFLLSLLPDIETLNDQEMRSFRREVIALLDNIMTTRESVIINLSSASK